MVDAINPGLRKTSRRTREISYDHRVLIRLWHKALLAFVAFIIYFFTDFGIAFTSII